MSASLGAQGDVVGSKQGTLHHVSATFSAASWVAMSDVVGESAAASLIQYMARTATAEVATARSSPPDVAAALAAAAHGVPFVFAVTAESTSRIELTWNQAALSGLPPLLRIAFTRGVFQGVLAATPAGAAWGVLVMEDRPTVILTRGIT